MEAKKIPHTTYESRVYGVRTHERQSFHLYNNNTIFVFAFQRRTEEGTTGLVNTYPPPRPPGVFAYLSPSVYLYKSLFITPLSL